MTKQSQGKTPKSIQDFRKQLLKWFKLNQRSLPWRMNYDPYRIWISEVMLQQTTVAAVLPYYERFINRFPTLSDLASADLNEVYSYWAGLGYYSRARNLHASALILNKTGFPRTADELIQLKGFGPYTSRAVASIAFNEPVGVLDGNVIRVLSRYFNLGLKHWTPKDKNEYQKISDQIALLGDARFTNQALMELGATVCTPKKPNCVLCPVAKNCEAYDKNLVEKLPLKKPRKSPEIWIWEIDLLSKNNQIALEKSNYTPFLKGQLLPPGKIFIDSKKPVKYHFKHSITHHQIYGIIHLKKSPSYKTKNLKWINIKDLEKHNPSSILKKMIVAAEKLAQI